MNVEAPEIIYIEGIKNHKDEIPNDLDFVLKLKDGISFGEFIESLIVVYPSNHLVLHCTDDDWYEEGEYQTGILHADLFFKLEEYFKKRNFLRLDETLKPTCFYSINSGRQNFIFLPSSRPNLMIEFSGGKFDKDGPFICCIIPDSEDFLEIEQPEKYLQNLRKIERSAISKND